METTLAAREALAPAAVDQGILQGIEALRRGGTALVGEVSNTGASLCHLENSPLEYHLFYECLGFNLRERVDLAASFPFLAESRAADKSPGLGRGPCSLFRLPGALPGHQPLERRLPAANRAPGGIPGGAGLFGGRATAFSRTYSRAAGRWVEDFQAPGPSPVAYLNELDFLGPRTLAVHGVWLDDPDCRLLAQSQSWLVLCPRANRYTGAGVPPVDRLLQAGVNLALGTDSLAGNWDLNLFGEMRWLHRNFPAYPGDLWLRLGTLNGARALGRDRDLGSLEPGKKATLGFIPLRRPGKIFGGNFSSPGPRGNFAGWLNKGEGLNVKGKR